MSLLPLSLSSIFFFSTCYLPSSLHCPSCVYYALIPSENVNYTEVSSTPDIQMVEIDSRDLENAIESAVILCLIGNAFQPRLLSYQHSFQLCSLFFVLSISRLIYSAPHISHLTFRSILYLFHVLDQIVSQPSGSLGCVSTFGLGPELSLDFKPRLAISYT